MWRSVCVKIERVKTWDKTERLSLGSRLMLYKLLCSQTCSNFFIFVLFCQCPLSISPCLSLGPQLSYSSSDLWDFGGCDRGLPVSVSLRAQQWHLTQYPRRIRFLPRSPPSSASDCRWSVSSSCTQGGSCHVKSPAQSGHPSPWLPC